MKKIHSSKTIEFFSVIQDTELTLPFAESTISAGFPSPAEDFVETGIDLNKELIKNPSATFYGRVRGESLKDFGINQGDLMIIDRSIEPINGKLAVCFIDGDFTAKQIKLQKDKCILLPANDEYEPIIVTEDNEFIIWGIVLHVIKSF